MDNSTQYDDELMRYIDGEMTESEKIDFEKQLAAVLGPLIRSAEKAISQPTLRRRG